MADASALKMQGSDTLGTPVTVSIAPPSSTGSTATAVRGSATGGNVSNVATLAAAVGKFTYICGFAATAAGATAALNVTVQIAGAIGGNFHYTFTFPIGAVVPAQPIIVTFNPPLQSNALNTAITVTLPAGGAGNTDASCCAWGFQQ